MAFRRDTEASLRARERRQREDDARRLLAEVPQLVSLEIGMCEILDGRELVETKHLRRIAVERAPALLDFLCKDPQCKGGGHDLTDVILRALRMQRAQFEGESRCNGSLAAMNCNRVLRYRVAATYKD